MIRFMAKQLSGWRIDNRFSIVVIVSASPRIASRTCSTIIA